MPRPKKRRKASEQGLGISTWWKLGTLRRVDRAAEREQISRSDFVERALLKELDVVEAARTAA